AFAKFLKRSTKSALHFLALNGQDKPTINFRILVPLRYLSLILILSISSITSMAQHTINGKVEDKISNIPLTGVTINILNTKDSILLSTSTNRLGIFSFKNIPKARYSIRPINLGYQPFKSSIILSYK